MRIIHIVPAISEEASGPSYSVVRLCEALIKEHHTTTLAALEWGTIATPPPFLRTFPLGLGPPHLGRSPAMHHWLLSEVQSSHVSLLHNHGMWQMNAVYPGWVARKRKANLVVSPRGTFSEWAMRHGSWTKKVFWPLLQRPSIDRATCFHATAESEYEDIRRLGFRQPVCIIPNGIDIPPQSQVLEPKSSTLLFLGRIHPKKGLDMLLPAWRAVQDRFPRWRLVIAGSDDGYHGPSGYLRTLRQLAFDLGLRRIEFVGELRGARKLEAYQKAGIFVLPTYSENFGMTVAEALAAGTPAIVTQGAPWEGMKSRGAGWWIQIGVDPLVACLEAALSRSEEELAEMGARGRAWMITDFSWSHVARRMAATYEWLSGSTAPAPPWVRTN